MKSRILLLSILSSFLLPFLHADAVIEAVITLRHGETPLGTVRIQLDHERAPRTVANFIGLATGAFNWIDPDTDRLMVNTPYYDGQIFHRLDHGFVIQGGDPTGTGFGGPGYLFQDEFHPGLRHEPYVISMANSGHSTNGSQFFIAFKEIPFLNDLHSVFGEIVDHESRVIIAGFQEEQDFETDANERPLTNIIMESVVIEGWDPESFDIHDAALALPKVKGVTSKLVKGANDQGEPIYFLEWDAEFLHKYPISQTHDLKNWPHDQDFAYIMDQNPVFQHELTAAEQEPVTFARALAVDYSMVPIAPINVFQPGAVLLLHTAENASYHFAFQEPDQQGVYGTWWVTGYDPAPILLADTGESFPSYGGTLEIFPKTASESSVSNRQFRLLMLRSIVVEIKTNNDPEDDSSSFVFGTLSFHSETQGWYYWTANDTNHRVPFTWIPPED
ncbi:MAG: peptidylprolyl isomerase [Verrucomicrobia bacterium]|nr:peptidylprolyl isomerase [Verrucomicrobiota bacterium]